MRMDALRFLRRWPEAARPRQESGVAATPVKILLFKFTFHVHPHSECRKYIDFHAHSVLCHTYETVTICGLISFCCFEVVFARSILRSSQGKEIGAGLAGVQ